MEWQRLVGPARFVVVTIGIVVLTSLSIDATNLFNGSQSALGILADRAVRSECPEEMVMVSTGDRSYCIDRYEAAVGGECPVPEPYTVSDTAGNINASTCVPEVREGRTPWTSVAVHQAEALCARAGKRLPTSEEWYRASLGTPDAADSCNTNSDRSLTGDYSACVSGVGAFDMIGNVWELVAGTVDRGVYEGIELPASGYVATVDGNGLPRTSTTTPLALFNDDYVWTDNTKPTVLMRGGFYGSQRDAGIYALHAAIDATFSSAAIGFRCVRDL